ncbi:DUF1349 domain-containing protein [Bifidobacterium sp.]|jgi:regulation of enolase protein 1 (concanavalin A-like superfamily)|uniref:DUF1349 domain-containing protein n=1 Tax=Bifidobacterium sp. TaxID=41200 RepID=UPI0025C4B59A|nr:DUF1349 domain-containing protein [Bifidobacterium sp.]MCH4209982.1 DUF1349 domain-containing protein [Bifidobacterium sp.]
MVREIPWGEGCWTHEPESCVEDAGVLRVVAREGGDAWRVTSYGFVHDSENALVAPFEPGHALEVTFRTDMSEQFDQAGLFIRADERHWVKAGLEQSDGVLQLGAVVTDERSDWSVARLPEWNHTTVTMRASWSHDAITLRAKRQGEDFRLVRVLPFDDASTVEAGPYICAPTRAGFAIGFLKWTVTDPDASLHA